MMSILGSSSAVTIQRVIVYHAGSLHERIEDGRADEFHAFFLQSFAHRIGDWGGGGHVGNRLPVIDDRRTVHEAPQIAAKAAVLPDNIEIYRSIGDHALDL
ncbi:hypothetical protein D3C73_1419780 [compost metagenome]